MWRVTADTYFWSMSLGLADPMLWFFWIMIFLFGCCWGSFLNVCIWRLPRGESVCNVPSHCPKCNHEIRWYDNLPLLSYALLRGRCRYCREPITPRYVVVEFLTGLLFLGAFLKVEFSGQPPSVLPLYFLTIMLAVATAFIDARHRIIPDALTLPALGLGAALSIAFPSSWGAETSYGAAALHTLLAGGITGGGLWLFARLGRLWFRREALGLGDVKFMAATAVLLGLPGAFFTLLAGSLLGTIAGLVLALRRKRKLRRIAIPFGPFLALAAVLWLFLGELLLDWYLTLIHLK